jgi:hypothetical protein
VESVDIQGDVTFSPVNVTDKIEFSRKAFFEVHDMEGNQIMKGTRKKINVEALSQGKYLLYLDGSKNVFYKQ